MRNGLAEWWKRTPRWVLLTALAAGLASLLLPASLTIPPALRPERRVPFLHLVAGSGAEDELVREQALLQDSAPLFLPTEMTYGVDRTPPGWRDQEQSPFGPEEPRLVVGVTGAVALLQAPDELPDEDAVLRAGFRQSLAAFGREPLKSLPDRFARLEVRAMEGGPVLGRIDIAAAEAALSEDADGLWQPAEWIVTLAAEGRIGRALLVRSSGSEVLDAFGERRLTAWFRTPPDLGPGIYRVVFGP